MRRRRMRTMSGMSRRILMRMRTVRSKRRRILMLRKGRNMRILLSLMRISVRLWESRNRRYLERIRKGRRSLRRRRKVHYN